MGKEELSREELFALVWEKPTVEVAKELGVSDVAVAKLCARLQVPKPPRGYWARIESGQTPRRTPLRAFREEIEARRKAVARPLPGVISLSPIQRKFVDHALSELAAKGVDIGSVRITSNQIRGITPDVAAQLLLLIQNRYLAWIKSGEVDVALTHGAQQSLGGFVDKMLPIARPQIVVLERAGRSFMSPGKEPTILIHLTADLQDRIAQLARLVRDQRLNHVVMPLVTVDHAWSAHHVYSAESYTMAESALCISATEIWVTCTIEALSIQGDERETFLTEHLALHDVMPIELMPTKEVEIPTPLKRIRIKQHWPRLRALIEAERVHEMLERSTYDIERSVPDERLAVSDRIWFGAERPLLNAHNAWERLTDEVERWELELEAERSDLCCTILGIELGDILVQPQKGQITRLQVTRTSMTISEERIILIIEGLRFRKDGTAGKRLESIFVDFHASSGAR
jgi:hypothetical protein